MSSPLKRNTLVSILGETCLAWGVAPARKVIDVFGEARDDAGDEEIRVMMVMGFFGVKRVRGLIVFLIVDGVDDEVELLLKSLRSPRTGRRIADAFDEPFDVDPGVGFAYGMREDDAMGILEEVAEWADGTGAVYRAEGCVTSRTMAKGGLRCVTFQRRWAVLSAALGEAVKRVGGTSSRRWWNNRM